MYRFTAVLILASCFTLLWARSAQGQTAEQVPAAPQKAVEQNAAPQKAGEQNAAGQNSAEATSATAPGAIETTEFPLDKFQNFSAVMNGGPVPGLNSDVHVYRSGNVMRVEDSSSPAVPSYYVTDLMKQKSNHISAHTCLNIHVPYVRSFPFFVTGPDIKYERIPIGEETVDGHQSHVEDLMIHNPKNPVDLHFRLYEADDLDGFPIKIENRRPKPAGQWVIRYKNVRLEPQDRTLFIVPDTCESDADWAKVGKKAKTAPAKKPQ